SPNIIVSRVREEIVGEPFRMFDFAPVGACLAVAGIVFLTFGWRLLPKHRKGASSIEAAFNLEGYTTEAHVAEDSPIVGKTVSEFEKLAHAEVEVILIVRDFGERQAVAGHTLNRADDMLSLQGEPSPREQIAAHPQGQLVTDP